MQIDYVPTLELQRELYAMPRDRDRFDRYIREMRGGSEDLALPLVAFNPMGREHVAEALDRLLAIDADGVARRTVDAVSDELPGDATLRVTLVLSDDLGGRWTHRASTEFGRIWEDDALLKRGWAVPLAWTSDAPSVDGITAEVRRTLYRAAYRLRRGTPTNLRELLLQEGHALSFAGSRPRLRAFPNALDRYSEASDKPTVFAALFGDRAARELGYAPLGIASDAGFAVALAIAEASGRSPIEALSGD